MTNCISCKTSKNIKTSCNNIMMTNKMNNNIILKINETIYHLNYYYCYINTFIYIYSSFNYIVNFYIYKVKSWIS